MLPCPQTDTASLQREAQEQQDSHFEGFCDQGSKYPDPRICRIIAFYRFWAIIFSLLGGLGRGVHGNKKDAECLRAHVDAWYCRLLVDRLT